MQTASQVTSEPPANSHIETTAGICGGKPRIAGTRIRVQDVVIWHERLSLSADEIATKYPQVSLADVYAALAYYHDHRTEIESQMQQGEQLVEELKKQFPSKLQAKLLLIWDCMTPDEMKDHIEFL